MSEYHSCMSHYSYNGDCCLDVLWKDLLWKVYVKMTDAHYCITDSYSNDAMNNGNML